MNVVALTGGIGSGKSAAAEVFKRLAVPVTDLDEISHQLSVGGSPIVEKIGAEFGRQYVTDDGALDRAMLRTLVFNDAEARAKLNAIMHPAIYQQALEQLQQQHDSIYQVLAIPLYVESPRYHPLVQHVLLIDCDEKIQIDRVVQRSQLSVAQVEQIIQAQAPRQLRLSYADTVINNDASLDDLQHKVREFHKTYINACILGQ
jgi:dephospho-CoA kinase